MRVCHIQGYLVNNLYGTYHWHISGLACETLMLHEDVWFVKVTSAKHVRIIFEWHTKDPQIALWSHERCAMQKFWTHLEQAQNKAHNVIWHPPYATSDNHVNRIFEITRLYYAWLASCKAQSWYTASSIRTSRKWRAKYVPETGTQQGFSIVHAPYLQELQPCLRRRT